MLDKADLQQIEKLLEKSTEKNNRLIFKRLEPRFDRIDQKFEQVDKRMDERFDCLEQRMDLQEQKFDKYSKLAEGRFTNLLNICTSLRSTQEVSRQQDEKLALEKRVTALETAVKDIQDRLPNPNH